MTFLNDWVIKLITGMVKGLAQLASAMSQPPDFYTDTWATNLHSLILALTLGFLGMRVVAVVFDDYLFRDNGQTLFSFIRRLFMTGFLIFATSWLLPWMNRLGSLVSGYIARDVATVNFDAWVQSILVNLTLLLNGMELGVIVINGIVLGLIFLACLLIGMQAYIRAATLALYYGFGPILATSAIGTDNPFREGSFSVWFREVVVLAFTGTVQTAAMAAVITYTMGSGFQHFVVLLQALPFLVLTLMVPNIVRQWVYATGGAGAGSLSSMANTGMQLAQYAKYIPW